MSDFKKYVNMYEFDTELPGSGQELKFRPITTGQIKRLLLYETSQDPQSIEIALDELISDCVITKDFNIDELYLQDRFYLMLDLRKATKGNFYSFQSQCTSCGSQTAQNINLSQLPVTKLDIPDVEPPKVEEKAKVKVGRKAKMVEKKVIPDGADEGSDVPVIEEEVPDVPKEPWNIVRLNDYLAIKLNLITRGMQKYSVDYVEKASKGKNLTDTQKAVEMTTLLYAMAIESIITPDGEDFNISLEDKLFLINNIPQSETDKMVKWFDDHDFGVDFSFDVVCSHCGYKERKAVPVESFFY